MNRTDRLVAMVMFLQGRRLVRAEDLAEHFEISVRTVYRDISALSEAGVPITGEAGVGYSLMKNYHLPPVMLTPEEASALFVGAEMANQLSDDSMRPAIDAALLKLRAILPRDRQDYVDQMTKKTVVIGRKEHRQFPEESREWLMPLQEAAVKRRLARITYRGPAREHDTQRDVEPLGVVFHTGLWYLIAYCRLRADLRHFRLDRIRRVELLDATFPARTGFSLAEHLSSIAEPEQLFSARLWVPRAALERLRRESMTQIVEERTARGGVEVSLGTCSYEWMARWIVSFGDEAEVLEPEELREHVCAIAQAALRRHATPAEKEAQTA